MKNTREELNPPPCFAYADLFSDFHPTQTDFILIIFNETYNGKMCFLKH